MREIENKREDADFLSFEKLVKVPYFLARGMKYHAAGRLYIPKPLCANILMTRRCNSRCIMCYVWNTKDERKELTCEEIRKVFDNELFDSIEAITLSGGEPTLREDLVQVAETILSLTNPVESLILITNGLDPQTVSEKVKGLLNLCHNGMLGKVFVVISLDGYGAVHEKIRRVPRAFERVNETIHLLKELQPGSCLHLHINSVVQKLNISTLSELARYAQELHVPINFVPAGISESFLNNVDSKDDLALDARQSEAVRGFLDHQLEHNATKADQAFWREYQRIGQGKKRKMPCALPDHVFTMDVDGTLLVCAKDDSLSYGNVRNASADEIWYSHKAREVRKRAKKHFCPTCTVPCSLFFSLTHEFFYYARFLIGEAFGKRA